MTPDLPEPLYLPEEEIVIHSRLPARLQCHVEKHTYFPTAVFAFYENFTEDISVNWDEERIGNAKWSNSAEAYISPPLSAKFKDGTGGNQAKGSWLYRKNFTFSQMLAFFYFGTWSPSAIYFVSLENYKRLNPFDVSTRNSWNFFAAQFWYSWPSHERISQLFKYQAGSWVLRQEKRVKNDFPANSRFYFHGLGGIWNDPVWLDDVYAYFLV